MANTNAVFKVVDDVRDTTMGRLLLLKGVTSIAILDALQLATEYDIFEALNEQFRLPAYFGWNWDALYDCLADLSWLSADRYFVVIENPHALETEPGHPHRLLLETLKRAAQGFSTDAVGGQGDRAEFTVLLLGSGDDELATRLRAAGVVAEASGNVD